MILEGTSADTSKMRIRREAVQGAIISLTVIFGIPLLRSRDPAETARLLCYASRQIRARTYRSLPREGKRPHGKLKIQLEILQGIPQIGPARAYRLLKTLGNVREVFNATEEQLTQIAGIGKNIARIILDCIEDERSLL